MLWCSWVFLGAPLGSSWCQETLVSQTAIRLIAVVFPVWSQTQDIKTSHCNRSKLPHFQGCFSRNTASYCCQNTRENVSIYADCNAEFDVSSLRQNFSRQHAASPAALKLSSAAVWEAVGIVGEPNWGPPLNPSVPYFRGVRRVSEGELNQWSMMPRGTPPSESCTPVRGRNSAAPDVEWRAACRLSDSRPGIFLFSVREPGAPRHHGDQLRAAIIW